MRRIYSNPTTYYPSRNMFIYSSQVPVYTLFTSRIIFILFRVIFAVRSPFRSCVCVCVLCLPVRAPLVAHSISLCRKQFPRILRSHAFVHYAHGKPARVSPNVNCERDWLVFYIFRMVTKKLAIWLLVHSVIVVATIEVENATDVCKSVCNPNALQFNMFLLKEKHRGYSCF